MTREEAISELQKAIDLIKQNGKDWLDERDIPILQMAITALKLSDSIMLQLDCKMFHSGVDVESTISEATPSVQFAKDTNVPISDCISRQAAIDMIVDNKYSLEYCKEHHIDFAIDVGLAIVKLSDMPSAQPESTRTFVELVVRYPDPELCTYKEYKGKPYYSIKYIENGETYVWYGTYNPEVLSQYLKEYFISSVQPDITPDGTLKVSIDADIANVGRILLSQAGTQYGGLYYKDAQPEIIRCRDCIWYRLNHGKKWCDHSHGLLGWTKPTDYCSMAERRTDER